VKRNAAYPPIRAFATEGEAVLVSKLEQAALDSDRDRPAKPVTSVSATIALVDKDGRIRRVERADAAGISRPRSEIVGQMIGDALCCVEAQADDAVCGLTPHCLKCPIRGAVNSTFQLGVGQTAVAARYSRHAADTTDERSVSITTVPMDALGSPLVLVYVEDVTEHQRAVEALRASEAQFRIVAENTYAWEVWAGRGHRYLYSSPSCERITGHTSAEFLADPDLFLRLIHPEDRPCYEAHRRAARQGLDGGEREFRIVRADGEVRWICHLCGPVYDEHGAFQGTRGSNRDITESKRVEAALQESERRYRAAEKLAMLGHWWANFRTGTSYWSEGLCRIFGVEPEENVNRLEDFLQFVHPEDRESVRRTGESSLPRGQTMNCEFRVVRKDGTLRYVHAFATPLQDAAGEFVIHSGILRDITDRQKAEEALRESEERYRSLVASSTDAVLLTAPDGRVFAANEAACRMFGRSEQELIQEGRAAILDMSDPRVAPMLEERARTGRFRGEMTHLRKDGTKFPCEISSAIFTNRQGEMRVSVFIRDITERKRVEAALMESEQRYRAAEKLAMLGHWWRNYKTETGYWSDGFCHIFGLAPGKRLDTLAAFLQLIHPEDRERVRLTIRNSLSSDQPYDNEYRILRKDGALRHVHVHAMPLRDDAGEVVIHSGIMEDVTERKQAEAALKESEERYRAAEKMALIGHWWRNYKTVKGYRSEGLCHFLGLGPAEDVDRFEDFLRHVHAEDRQPLREAVYGSLSSGQPLDFEFRIVRKDGTLRHLHVRAMPLRDETGEFASHSGICQDITERKQMEMALQQSEQRYRAAEKLGLIGHWWRNYKTLKGYRSDGICDILGIAAEENVDRTEDYLQIVHPEDRELFRLAVRDSLSSGKPLDCEYRVVRKDGALRHLHVRAVPVRDETGEFASHSGICQDITERKRAEEALRESEDRYRSLVTSSKDAVLLTALDGRIFAANEAACRMFGRSEQELIQCGRHGLVDTSDPRVPLLLEERARTGRVSGEVTFVRKDGTKFPCELSSAVFTNRHGELRASIFIRDITERKRADMALQEGEQRYRIAEKQALLGHWWRDHKTQKGFWSQGVCHIFGFAPEVHVDSFEDFLRLVHPEDRQPYRQATYDSLSSGQPLEFEFRIFRKDGRLRHLYARAMPIRDGSGEFTSQTGICQDITERKQAEEALRASEERFRTLAEMLPEIIYETDEKGHITYANQRAFQLTGRRPEDLMKGVSPADFVVEADRDRTRENVARVLHGEPLHHNEYTFIRADGHTFPVIARALPIWRDGRIVGLRGMVVDLTEVKYAEDTLRRMELLAATGRMAAEIAHEINNPLAGIKNAFTLLKDNISLDHPHYAYVAIVEREIDRVASIVRRMYELQGKKETVAQECEVRRALQDVIALASLGAQSRGVNISFAPSPEPVQAQVGEESLKEVFFNIIENAVEASASGAAVRVTLSAADGAVRVSVADSGPGIPPDVAPRIFEPFFTTKNGSTMRGMGLGLPISQRIIKRMGGNIEFETVLGRGSTFHIVFPQGPPS
jgi:PAS domain S-box-containing protein